MYAGARAEALLHSKQGQTSRAGCLQTVRQLSVKEAGRSSMDASSNIWTHGLEAKMVTLRFLVVYSFSVYLVFHLSLFF